MKRKFSIKEAFVSLLPLLLVANLLIIAVPYIVDNVERAVIQDTLSVVEPIFLAVNFTLIVGLFAFNFKSIKKQFSKIKRTTWLLLLIILIMGFVLRTFVAPRTHRLYFDEDIYLDIGKQILTEGKGCLCNYGDNNSCYNCELMKWPNGHPFILTISYMIFGISETVGFNLILLLSVLSIALVFIIGYLLTRNESISLYSALLFALVPIPIMWSGTVAPEPTFVFFALLSIAAFLLTFEIYNWKMYLLAVASLAYAMQIKTEGGMLLAVIGALILLFDKKLVSRIKTRSFLFSWIIFLVLITPYLIHASQSAKYDPWGASEEKFALKYAIQNIPTNLIFWISGYPTIEHPALFTIFAIVGLIYSLFADRRKALFLGFWFASFFLMYAFFYAGSVRYGVDVRYQLIIYPAFALLGGYGLFALSNSLGKKLDKRIIQIVLIAIIFTSFYFYVPSIATPAEKITEANQARKYHDFVVAGVDGMNENCYFLSHVPSIFLMYNRGSLQTWYGQNKKDMDELFAKNDCIIFDDGFWCNVEPYRSSVCKHMFDEYDLTALASVEIDQGREYTLYKVEQK